MSKYPIRAIIIILDGVGIGAMPDALEYGDEGANTLGNLSRSVPSMKLPNLARLGLSQVVPNIRPEVPFEPYGAYGKARLLTKAKDTISGHWEIAGIVQDPPFRTYADGFPKDIVEKWCKECGLDGVLGNCPAPGTAIIEELGKEHLRTGLPILYTSADSVFQVAAHEDVIPPARLYEICMLARDLLKPPHLVGRVIARPFVGGPGRFRRTENRRDFPVPPPGTTLLDRLYESGFPVLAIGKVEDIFCRRGITYIEHTKNNADGIRSTIAQIQNGPAAGLVFTNLGDFDTLYGHRRNPHGYAAALEQFDGALSQILNALRSKDFLIITGDHGCDPTLKRHTDHTREEVPLLIAGDLVHPGCNLGLRASLADISATICEALGLSLVSRGKSFWKEIIQS